MKGKGEYGTGREGNCTPRQNPSYVSGDFKIYLCGLYSLNSCKNLVFIFILDSQSF
jgi:hypothetical protein